MGSRRCSRTAALPQAALRPGPEHLRARVGGSRRLDAALASISHLSCSQEPRCFITMFSSGYHISSRRWRLGPGARRDARRPTHGAASHHGRTTSQGCTPMCRLVSGAFCGGGRGLPRPAVGGVSAFRQNTVAYIHGAACCAPACIGAYRCACASSIGHAPPLIVCSLLR